MRPLSKAPARRSFGLLGHKEFIPLVRWTSEHESREEIDSRSLEQGPCAAGAELRSWDGASISLRTAKTLLGI